MHNTECCQSGFNLEVHWCERLQAWHVITTLLPNQLQLFPDDVDATESTADGIWTAVKGSLRAMLTSQAGYRAAEARAALRQFDGNGQAAGQLSPRGFSTPWQ